MSFNYISNPDGSNNQLNNFLTGGSLSVSGEAGLGLVTRLMYLPLMR